MNGTTSVKKKQTNKKRFRVLLEDITANVAVQLASIPYSYCRPESFVMLTFAMFFAQSTCDHVHDPASTLIQEGFCREEKGKPVEANRVLSAG